jgi:hypothetical protein
MKCTTLSSVTSAAGLLGFVFFATAAVAGDAGSIRAPALDPVYQAECGSCHLAYPPRFLGADSWRLMMGSLDEHFGSDASLDETTRTAITDLLVANARKKPLFAADGTPLLRITEARWFVSEHRPGHHGIRADTFTTAPVNSPSNCAACHRDAESGRIGESRIRIPPPQSASSATTQETVP